MRWSNDVATAANGTNLPIGMSAERSLLGGELTWPGWGKIDADYPKGTSANSSRSLLMLPR